MDDVSIGPWLFILVSLAGLGQSTSMQTNTNLMSHTMNPALWKWVNRIANNCVNWPVLKVDFSESGLIDGCVGGGVDANDGDVLEVKQTVQTQD